MHNVFSTDCKTTHFSGFVSSCTYWIYELTSLVSQFLNTHLKEKNRHSSRFIGIVMPKCWFVQHQWEKTICTPWETKNKMEPNPFPFKCLEFTLCLEQHCQRTDLRGCCNKSIQQRSGRDAECRRCSALCKPSPGKMTSCPACSVRHSHLLDNSYQTA